jgi:hypothetical protein
MRKIFYFFLGNCLNWENKKIKKKN